MNYIFLQAKPPANIGALAGILANYADTDESKVTDEQRNAAEQRERKKASRWGDPNDKVKVAGVAGGTSAAAGSQAESLLGAVDPTAAMIPGMPMLPGMPGLPSGVSLSSGAPLSAVPNIMSMVGGRLPMAMPGLLLK